MNKKIELKPIEEKPCYYKGREITCEECIETIYDRNIDVKSCEKYSKGLFEGQLIQHRLRRKADLEYLTCDCGNKIKITRYTTERVCYNCGANWIKQNGTWQKLAFKTNKNTLTIKDTIKTKK